MIRRCLIVLLSTALAFATVESVWPTAAYAKDGDSGGGGSDEGGHGGGDGGRGGDSSGRGGGDSGRDDRGGDDGGQGRGRGGDDGGQGRGRGRGGDDVIQGKTGWGSTSPENARDAVSHGWALGLGVILPTVTKAVPGQILEVDLRQTWSGAWQYEFLILTRDRHYLEVDVDARANRILQIRRR
ncbi:PepSY domain-containing protein [Microvirga sp. 2YAF29]|uniref:PepSY domain-containing protein n=1 Tax=Microvirga sp. 2YAF29 TaxID=3233031 RepID=UPI003F94DA54